MDIPDYAVIIPSVYAATGLASIAAAHAFNKYGDAGKATPALSVKLLRLTRHLLGP